MKQKLEIIFSGVGGQGLLLSGNILGSTVTILEDKQAVMTSTYGTETRGTFTKSDLIISDEYIEFPEVISADVVIALAQVAYDRYVENMKEGSIILYNSDQVEETESKAIQYGLPMEKIAAEVKNPKGVNVVALGGLISLTECAKPELVKEMLGRHFAGKEKIIESNKKAFDLGYERGLQLK